MADATKTSEGGVTPSSSGLREELKRFRSSTIQRDYTFVASFLDTDLASLIEPQQIVGIGLPQWQFTKNAVYKNMYPIAYAKYDSDGWETRVIIRETAFGTVRTLVDKLVSKIRKPNGYFNSPNQSKILGMQIKILDMSGHITDIYQLRNMMFLSTEDLMFKHDGSDIMAQEITFHVEDVLRVGNV